MITGIMIDSREAEWVKTLQFGGIPTMVTFLDHGDCMAATNDDQVILIERKTPDDFLNSLRDGRLLPQLAAMLDQTRWSYLVITDEIQRGPNGNAITGGRGNTGWNWASIQGALLTIQEMGIFVTYAGGESDYENCILRIGNRERKKDLLLEPPKFPRILSASEAVIASLPGIGTERLQAILDYCGTPAWALVALTDKDSEIPEVPRNVKVKVRAALKLRDAEQIAVITNDDGDEILTVTTLGAQ